MNNILPLFFVTLLPRLEIAFVCQMVAIYAVIRVSLFYLTGNTFETSEYKLSEALLSSCLGCMLLTPIFCTKKY